MTYRFIGVVAAVLVVVALVSGCGNKQTQNALQETSPRVQAPEIVQDAPVVLQPFAPIEGEYTVLTDVSTIRWEAKNPLVTQRGTIALANGSLEADDVAFSKGNFVIDMTSMTHDGGSDTLLEHLQSEDFFDVAQYPESKLVFTGMQRTGDNTFTVSGNLTIKDETHTILIPAVIQNIENGYRATATFSIDRTKWGVRFGSSNFFGNLGDKAIDDMIQFELDLTALSTASIAEEQK